MKSKYQIGDWVEVTATVTFDIDEKNQRKIVRHELPKTFVAQIVGAANRQVGIYHRGNYDPYDGGDSAYLECKGTVLVWLVRRGMTNRQIDVLPNDLTHGIHNVKQSLPWRWTNSCRWSDEDRKSASEDAKNFPRDPRTGKFTRGRA